MDRQFQASKADALGAQEFTMTVAGTAQQPEVTTLRRFPTRSLPEFVKALVNPTMLVTERERWAAATGTESRQASFDVDVDGAPIRVRGSLVVQASDGDTTTVRFYGELQSTVPLFRKQVEVAGSAEVCSRPRSRPDTASPPTAVLRSGVSPVRARRGSLRASARRPARQRRLRSPRRDRPARPPVRSPSR
jgi:hypothetical protein